ncbi:MAG: hypothetical protein R2705_11995 [Ilumatobacteraceae bacterium]
MGTSNRAAENASSDRYAGLDAVRVIAVVVVVLFHAGALIPGGLLGVSVFFVLSGFLVGRAAVGELGRRRDRPFPLLEPPDPATDARIPARPRRHRVDLGPAGRRSAPRTSGAACSRCGTGRCSSTHAGYGAAPSPTEHYWSLAVEEQVYLVLPVLLVAVVSVARRSAAAIVAVIAVASMVGCAWTCVELPRRLLPRHAVAGGEVMAGVALAGWMQGRAVKRWVAEGTASSASSVSPWCSRHCPGPTPPCLGSGSRSPWRRPCCVASRR